MLVTLRLGVVILLFYSSRIYACDHLSLATQLEASKGCLRDAYVLFSLGINKLRFVCFRLLSFAVYLLLLFTIHVFAFPVQLVDCFVVFGPANCPILVISI